MTGFWSLTSDKCFGIQQLKDGEWIWNVYGLTKEDALFNYRGHIEDPYLRRFPLRLVRISLYPISGVPVDQLKPAVHSILRVYQPRED